MKKRYFYWPFRPEGWGIKPEEIKINHASADSIPLIQHSNSDILDLEIESLTEQAQEEYQAPQVIVEQQASENKTNILIIEDNLDMRNYIQST